MESSMEDGVLDRTQATTAATQEAFHMMTKRGSSISKHTLTQPPASQNLFQTQHQLIEHLQQPESERGTYLYLGYGSNLSSEKFKGDRGIKPLSQINVQVPTLRLTFDLPGIPYTEPCFANSGRRDPDDDRPTESETIDATLEKAPLLAQTTNKDHYHKDRWHKGLIGVVWEVTPQDYAHIIETEGGGASYHDIVVDCHPLPAGDISAPLPQDPTLPPFKAHTLFAPATDPDEPPSDDGRRFQRPEVSYAQPSARYLKLMTDGAAELGLPIEYQDYLQNIRPYTITTARQRVGSFVFLSVWLPVVGSLFALAKLFSDKKGRLPLWLRSLFSMVFKVCWISYDSFFRPIFGDGERSIPDGGGDKGMRISNGRSIRLEEAKGPTLDLVFRENPFLTQDL
jgi:hypothetical protein